MDNLLYQFSSEIWLWQGEKAAWVFVSVPKEESDHMRYFASHLIRGFKSLKVEARIGDSVWQTSVFPSKAHNTYLLPLKKSVRTAQGLDIGDTARVSLRILS